MGMHQDPDNRHAAQACLRKEYDLSIVSDVPAMIAGILCDFEKKNLLEPDHQV